jgi:hypothetical protein
MLWIPVNVTTQWNCTLISERGCFNCFYVSRVSLDGITRQVQAGAPQDDLPDSYSAPDSDFLGSRLLYSLRYKLQMDLKVALVVNRSIGETETQPDTVAFLWYNICVRNVLPIHALSAG